LGGKYKQESSLEKALPRGVSIRHHKHGSAIQIYFSYRGRDCRETIHLPLTKSSIEYARNKRGAILIEIEKGTFRYEEHFPNSNRARLFGCNSATKTIGELLTEHLKAWEKTLQPSTVRGYRIAINAHLLPQFGKVRVKELSRGMICDWVRGLGITTKRVRNVLTPLNAVLKDAVNDGAIFTNPLDNLDLNKLLDKDTRESTFEADPFSRSEVNAILAVAQPQARNLFQFAFYTGLRTSELIALEWSDIDWKSGVVRVSRAFVEGAVKGTKTRAGVREVLLAPEARDALEKQKKLTLLQGGRIFHNPRTKKPWVGDAQIRRTCWTPLLRKAEVRYRNPYQTRHTFASALLSDGKNPWWVAQQMGHKTVEMIMRRYGRWLPDYAKPPQHEPDGPSQSAEAASEIAKGAKA
jgi:integrase